MNLLENSSMVSSLLMSERSKSICADPRSVKNFIQGSACGSRGSAPSPDSGFSNTLVIRSPFDLTEPAENPRTTNLLIELFGPELKSDKRGDSFKWTTHLTATVLSSQQGVWGLGFRVWGLGFGRSEEH